MFQSRKIRWIWYDDEWFFSIIDIIAALTDSIIPRDYWFKMKIRVKDEDSFEPWQFVDSSKWKQIFI